MPTLSLDNPMWMQLTNTTMQYVSAVMPEKGIPQLVKRMHYVSFVGMFRSDLFEGLCVGHAPRKCPICGKWFLTTDARQTKYCGGLAPGDKLGRTCRQIGNLKGREQRELADDHPIRAIYNRRMKQVDNAGTLEMRDEKKLLSSGGAYFVHSGRELLGIGWLQEEKLLAVASVKPGSGELVMKTLLSVRDGEPITLEVASTNRRAIGLYERLGFMTVGEVSRWYQII